MKLWPRSTVWLRQRPSRKTKSARERNAHPEFGGRSLRLRLLSWIVIFLTPAALVSLLQGIDLTQRDVAAVRERLVQTARATANDTENVFASAEQILRALANQPQIHEGEKNCGDALSNALKGTTYFTDLARVDALGNVICTSSRPDSERNVAGRPWWPDANRRWDFFVTPQIYSVTANRPVLAGVLPLRTDVGRFDGVMTIALDVSWLDYLLRAKSVAKGAVVAVFDTAGTMIASTNDETAVAVFGNPAKPGNEDGGLMSAADPKGTAWSYAVIPLSARNAYIGFAMPDSELFAGTYLHVGADLLLPVLMTLAAIAIWIATDRQVTRWIVYLRRVATVYARGHYAIRPVALESAPSEFRTLGAAFSGMASAVQDRDRRLRDAIEQKSLLIKEIHHRVKNNLQIVMSLLSLQTAQVRDPAAQNVLKQAQVRVNALALVHRILHEIGDQGAVALKFLLEDLGSQIQKGFGANRRDLRLDIEVASVRVPGDLAVPLTLFTVEVLTNAFKHAYPAAARGGLIKVNLSQAESGMLRLVVEDDGVGWDRSAAQSGIGWRLIQAFAQQLGGEACIRPREGGGTVVGLHFPDPSPGSKPV